MAAAGREGDVQLALRDPDEAQRQRADAGRHRNRRRGGGRQRLHEPLGARHPGALQPSAGARLDRRAVAGGAGTGGRHEQLVGRRREHPRQDRTAVIDQRGRDHPIGPARQVGPGAVDRVHDPQPPRLPARAVVGGFLRQPAAVGAGEPPAQKIVHRDIGFADRRRLVLEPTLHRRPEGRERDRARLAQRRRQHPQRTRGGEGGITDPQRSNPPRAASAHWCHSGTRDRRLASARGTFR